MFRRILTIIVSSGAEQPQWIVMPRSSAFSETLDLLMKPEVRKSDLPENWSPDKILLFDWYGRPLPVDIRIGEIPLPGIIVAVIPSEVVGHTIFGSAETNLWLFRQSLMRDEVSYNRLTRFLSSPDATVIPSPFKEIDVFISYSFEDGLLAASIVNDLEARGLRVFIAESSMTSGRQWRDQLRNAVRSCRMAILLLTHSSLHSLWVLAEAGALASQDSPTIVLFDGIEEHEIPAPLQDVGARVAVSQSERWRNIVGDYIRSPDTVQT